MKIFIKICLTIVLCAYLLILSKLILFKYLSIPDIIAHFTFSYDEYYWRSNNFIPFKTIFFYLFLADVNLIIRVANLIGNIIGFIPFGFILPLLLKKFQTTKKIILATLWLSFTYELIQLVFSFGSFDVDDLILNTLGGMIGYVVFRFSIRVVSFVKKESILKA